MTTEKPKYLMLKFSGDKKELHQQLKVWCAENNEGMGKKVIDLIQELLEAKNK